MYLCIQLDSISPESLQKKKTKQKNSTLRLASGGCGSYRPVYSDAPATPAECDLRLRLFGHAMAIARMGLFSEIAVYFKDSVFRACTKL